MKQRHSHIRFEIKCLSQSTETMEELNEKLASHNITFEFRHMIRK